MFISKMFVPDQKAACQITYIKLFLQKNLVKKMGLPGTGSISRLSHSVEQYCSN